MRPVRHVRRRLLSVAGSLLIVAGLLPVAAVASTSGVVISEFRTRGPAGGNDEFVELRNAGAAAVDISGWRLQGCASASGVPSDRTTVPAEIVLAPGQSYLFANTAANGYSGTVTPDRTYATGFTDFDGTNQSGMRIVTASIAVVDGVGAPNSPCREGTGFVTPGLPNGDHSFERLGGTQDTDNNAADFLGPKPGNPQNSGITGTDAAPTVTDTDPDSNAVDVPQNSNITVTFSEDVTTSAAAFSISCDVSGLHTFMFSGGPATYTLDPDVGFGQSDTCTVTVDDVGVRDVDTDDPPDRMAADFTFSFSTTGVFVRIHDIQGAQHRSPYEGALVSGVPGVVTARKGNGFYYQDPLPDKDSRTSEAIFVFTSAAPPATAAVGAAVTVSGRVAEFRPGGDATANLSTTEIVSPAVTPLGPGAPIRQTVVGQPGRRPPTTVIDDDASGDVETSGIFDPARDGIDFYESLEAMLLRVNNPVVVGPRNNFGEVWVLADNGSAAGIRTNRRGIVIRKLGSAPYPRDYQRGDFNPERIQLEDDIVPGGTPTVNVGDRFTSAAVGVLDYNFGNFEIQLTSALTRVDRGLKREVTRRPRSDELAVASFNVENLDPSDSPEQFAALARLIVNNMRAPDLIAIEEIQDNDGAASAAPTDASVTWGQLIEAIQTAGGPLYDYRQIDPVSNQDGGEPNGNIRVGFLFRTDRGLAFVDRAGGTAVNATHEDTAQPGAQLTLSPGRIDPTNTAFTNSRKPLAGEFTWRGETFFAVANHFNSKGGDHPLFGRYQPPLRSSEVQRHQQAAIVNAFVDELLAADRRAKVIVLGDINDFEFSTTTAILKGGVLTTLIDTLPREERYTYVFEGNSQVLDQILVSQRLRDAFRGYDSIHVNAEFHDQVSDHDPQLARFRFGGRDD